MVALQVESVHWEDYVGRTVRVMRPFQGRVILATIEAATDIYVKMRFEKSAPFYIDRHAYILAPEETTDEIPS